MPYNPDSHHRRSIRLPGYDYTQAGAYFVTICVQERRCLFGEIADGRMAANPAGKMVEQTWCELAHKYPSVLLDAFVLMPNHVHFVVVLTAPQISANDVRAGMEARPQSGQTWRPGQPRGAAPTSDRPALPDVVHWFKSLTTARYRHGVADCHWMPFPGRLWQRNYYEHIVRDETDMQRIQEYIATNPMRWEQDQLHPANPSPW
jgi:REP element-mobilizing transposase RayT